MSKLSVLADSMTGSEIVKLGNDINELKAQGEEIMNFTIGDFDPSLFQIPSALEDLIIDRYKSHKTNYPPGQGILELRASVASFLKERQGMDYSTDEILIASGGRPLIYAAFRTVVDSGDKVIYPVPSWNNNHYTYLTGGSHCPIIATPENNFMPSSWDIAENIDGASLVCICTPQNPTGTVIEKDELIRICDIILEENFKRKDNTKKVYLLFDQMYWTLTYGDTQHYNPVVMRPEMKKYTIFIDGISKAFAATGVRVGWTLAPKEIIDKMKSLLSHIGAWAPMAEQSGTAEFLKDAGAINDYFENFKSAIEKRLKKFYKGFKRMKEQGYPVNAIYPQAAIYLTIQIVLTGKTFDNSILYTQDDVTAYLLKEAGLAIVPFYCFGASKDSQWYRLSVGTCSMNQIDTFFTKLQTAIDKLL